MKHKTLRTLLCVILTVCFCLSAIAPVSAAGLFGGDTGAASIFDEWIRSLKDRFMEKNPGTDETPAEQTATGDNFIRIFHLDCGRKYFSVEQIEAIIDQLAANHYTHIELAFGNDGFRFLLDEKDASNKDITFYNDGKKDYTLSEINTAIHNANVEYCQYSDNKYELTQNEMDSIINYASGKGIGVIPLLNIPGHTNTLVNAMYAIGAPVFPFTSNNNSKGYPTQSFNVLTEGTAEFVIAFVKKYVDYFAEKECTYFNFGADECGYDNFSKEQYTALASMLTNIVSYIKANNMTPMMFNDGLRSTNSLADSLASNKGIAVCFWEMQKNYYTAEQLKSKGFTVINTHNKWYYVAGNGNSTSKNWSDWAYHYDYAQEGIDTYGCKSVDGGGTADKGCMLAYWCDDPTANYDSTERSRVYELIGRLANNNPDYFKAPVTPTITVSANSLTVGGTATLSTSDGSLATWASSDEKVLEVVATKDVVVATKDVTAASVTVRAVGAGTATVTAKLSDGTTLTSETITVRNQGEVTYERLVTVTVGQTLTLPETISGQYDGTQKNDYAKVVAVSQPKSSFTKTISYTNGGDFYISTNSNDSAPTIQITIESDGNSYYYLKNANGQYIYPDRTGRIWNYSYSLAYGKKAVDISIGLNGEFTISRNNAYLSISDGSLTSISGNEKKGLYLYSKNSSGTNYETVVTVTGKKVTTNPVEMIVGTVKYLITVTAEDLSSVTPLPIQTWVTNNAVELNAGKYTTASMYTTESYYPNWADPGVSNYQYAKYVEVNANAELNTASGIHIQDLMPDSVKGFEYANTYWKSTPSGKTATEQELVVWSGRVHTASANNIQKIAQDDFSNSGTEFYYIRYFNGKWAVSKDGSIDSWIEVDGTNTQSTEQIVVYYMVRTKITDEVTTDVADWGKPKDSSGYDSQVGDNFVLLDFAVKYEGGTRNPNTFPVKNKTLAYHCASGDAAVGTNNNTDYRKLFNFRGIETSDYEVYMVTVTMTDDSASTQLTSSEAKTKNGYTYAGEEKVAWAIDTDTYNKSGLNPYESLSGNYSFDVTDTNNCIGGDPYVRGVDVYNKHGALITYYIRAVQKKDSLTVNYFVEGVDTPFYSYFINVDANATHGKNKFDKEIALNKETATSWKGNLVHGDVINIKDNTEWVSANLETMPAIGAQYRFSKYECIRVVRESDKVVNLYYKFTANASFVVDFGLPITITPADLSQNLTNANITGAFVSNTPYANVKMDGKNIIYQLNKPLDRVDTFTIKYKGKNKDTLKDGEATFTINIIPATNVLYEENFINVAENSVWEQTGTARTTKQDLENIDNQKNVYGYDPAYGDDVTPQFSMNGVRKTTLTLTADEFSKKSDDALTFTFEGDGYDLISACGSDTGHLYVRTSLVNEDGTKTLKAVSIIDTYFSGDNTGIIEYGTLDYQVPVIRKMNLDYGEYEVEVYGYLKQSSGAMNPTQPANKIATFASLDSPAVIDYEPETNSIVEDILADFGDTDLSGVDVTVTFMDVNSVLNGGTGVQTCNVPQESMSKAHTVYDVQASANDYKAGSAVVYVDGFRVYNPIDITKANATDATEAAKNEAKTAAAAYEKNNEAKVKYYSLYDFVKTSINDLGKYNDKTAIYVEYDGDTGKYTIADYKEQGPNNEIYLTAGNAIAFALAGYPEDDKDVVVQYSARAVTYGALTDATSTDMSSTEMYYSVEVINNYDFDNVTKIPYVIITNSGKGVLAVSGLKVSENLKPYASAELADKVTNSLNPSTETSFVPATLNVTAPGTVKLNRNFSIRIDASAYKSDGTKDVAKVTIVEPDSNNEKELTATNTKAVASGRSMNYRYSQLFKQTTAGEYTYTIYAYNSNGVKSDPVTVTITVQ